MFSYYIWYIVVYIRIGQVYQEQFFVQLDGKENIEKTSKSSVKAGIMKITLPQKYVDNVLPLRNTLLN